MLIIQQKATLVLLFPGKVPPGKAAVSVFPTAPNELRTVRKNSGRLAILHLHINPLTEIAGHAGSLSGVLCRRGTSLKDGLGQCTGVVFGMF